MHFRDEVAVASLICFHLFIYCIQCFESADVLVFCVFCVLLSRSQGSPSTCRSLTCSPSSRPCTAQASTTSRRPTWSLPWPCTCTPSPAPSCRSGFTWPRWSARDRTDYYVAAHSVYIFCILNFLTHIFKL